MKPVLTICASGKFREAVSRSTDLLSPHFVVLPPPLPDIDMLTAGRPPECHQYVWKGATWAHFARIDRATVVLFLNPGGYLGVGTTLELGYSIAKSKYVVSLQPDLMEPARNVLIDQVLHTDDIDKACQSLIASLCQRAEDS